MEKLTKENTVLDTSKLTDEQKGIVFDIMSINDPTWFEAGWYRNNFIRDWGIGILEDHATIAYAPRLNEREPYNSELYFKNHYFDATDRVEITFEQWSELHKK